MNINQRFPYCRTSHLYVINLQYSHENLYTKKVCEITLVLCSIFGSNILRSLGLFVVLLQNRIESHYLRDLTKVNDSSIFWLTEQNGAQFEWLLDRVAQKIKVFEFEFRRHVLISFRYKKVTLKIWGRCDLRWLSETRSKFGTIAQ